MGYGVLAGLVPRLSGSGSVGAERKLPGVERWRRRRISGSCGVFSAHEIAAHESNEFEEAARLRD
jgi:hypothetical protein